jgi:topoisomerase-4 subunit A
VFREDGKMIVSKISQKAFVGKNIIYASVWKKDDKRTIYNLIYQDGKTGPAMMKRFPVTSITRDKEYDLTKGTAGSKVLWFTANPNGEAESILVKLRPKPGVRKLKFEIEFSELAIKGRAALGNRVTKYPIAKIELKEKGVSTLSARKIWFDDTVQRLNSEGRGDFLGEFKTTDKILTIMQSGEYQLTGFDLFTKFDENMIVIEKWNPKKPISAIYFDGDKQQYNVKRFLVEPSNNKVLFITEHPNSFLELVSTDWKPQIQLNFAKDKGVERASETLKLEEFIAIKGLKAIGNRLTTYKVKNIDLLEPLPYEEPVALEVDELEELEDEGFDGDHEENDELETTEDEIPTVEIKLPLIEKKGPIKPIIDDDSENQMTLF